VRKALHVLRKALSVHTRTRNENLGRRRRRGFAQ
jgi:hypothetical protein